VSRLIFVLTGLWAGLLAASWMFASITFGTATALSAPDARAELREKTAALPDSDRRIVLRFMASEINRTMFRRWLFVQFALGGILLLMAARQGWTALYIAAALVLMLVQLGLAPQILAIGRSIDFLPRPLPADIGARFGRLHGAYVLLDFAKMAALLLYGWRGGRD
jgi:hypothetical protein